MSKFEKNFIYAKKRECRWIFDPKKNPLTLPPDFSELPKPKDELNTEELEDENLDLSEVLGKSKSKDVTDPTSEIEKSISNILKKKWFWQRIFILKILKIKKNQKN